jgi:hypothetical protein
MALLVSGLLEVSASFWRARVMAAFRWVGFEIASADFISVS